jgi:hypothetical protein
MAYAPIVEPLQPIDAGGNLGEFFPKHGTQMEHGSHDILTFRFKLVDPRKGDRPLILAKVRMTVLLKIEEKESISDLLETVVLLREILLDKQKKESKKGSLENYQR